MTATIARFALCRCNHDKGSHERHELAPQCLSKNCQCLAYRPAPVTPGQPVPSTLIRVAPQPIRQPHRQPPLPSDPPPEPTGVSVTGERPPSIETWLRRGRESSLDRTRKLAEKIAIEIADLRGRITDEERAEGEKAARTQAQAAARAEIAALEQQLAEKRAALKGGTFSPRRTHAEKLAPATYGGAYPCRAPECSALFDRSQARAGHERYKHPDYHAGTAAAQ